jgi:hypothetical protein
MADQEVLAPRDARRRTKKLPTALAARLWRPGQSGNPSGRSGRYGEMQRLCREFSPQGAQVLIDIALDPNEDSRCRIVATQELFSRGWGKAPEYDPKADEPETPPIDPSQFSPKQREQIKRVLLMLLGAQPAETGEER